MNVLAADGQQDLADGHPGADALGLAKGAAHAGLQAIRARARQHLVDAQHVEGVHAHAQVERVLARVLDHVLIGGDTGRLQSLAGHLLLLPTAQQRLLVRPCPGAVYEADLSWACVACLLHAELLSDLQHSALHPWCKASTVAAALSLVFYPPQGRQRQERTIT